MINCKNCNTQFEGNYCNNCGQSAKTYPINFHFIWHDFQESFFHFERGILFTIAELFTHPGLTIHEYLDGKRVKHIRPITFVVILATINGLLYHYLNINIVSNITSSIDSRPNHIAGLINEWRLTHFSIIELLTLPSLTIASWIVFQKSNRNIVEHFVLNAFLTGLLIIASVVLLPLFYFVTDISHYSIVLSISQIVKLGIIYWVYFQFFNQKAKIKLVLKTFLTLLLFYVLFSFTMISIVIINKYLSN